MGPFGLILRARSMHTVGMCHPIGAVAVDRRGRVVSATIVPPRRLWAVPGAALIIEVPVGAGLPEAGSSAQAYRRRSALSG